MAATYEYQYVQLKREDGIEDQLNLIAAEGWALHTFIPSDLHHANRTIWVRPAVVEVQGYVGTGVPSAEEMSDQLDTFTRALTTRLELGSGR